MRAECRPLQKEARPSHCGRQLFKSGGITYGEVGEVLGEVEAESRHDGQSVVGLATKN